MGKKVHDGSGENDLMILGTKGFAAYPISIFQILSSIRTKRTEDELFLHYSYLYVIILKKEGIMTK